MKTLKLILVCFLAVISLISCGKEEQEPEIQNRPPAFSVIQNQLKLTKHSESSESASFSKSDFSELLGEDLTYITVTALPEAEKGTLVFNGQSVTKGQNIPAAQLEFFKFVPNGNTETANFTFTCDGKSYAGCDILCEIVCSDGINSPPVALNSTVNTVEGIPCQSVLKITEPNNDEFTINVITYPQDGFITVSSAGEIIYTPEEGFHGKDEMIFSVTDRFGKTSETASLEITVEKNQSGIYFADMAEDYSHLYAHRMCRDNVMVYRYENGSYYFDPSAEVTKMEFLVMMMNVSELDSDITAVADSIVTDDSGLSSGLKGYLSAASEKGLLLLQAGSFAPSEGITLSEAAYMISSALKLPNSGSVSADTTGSGALSAVVDAGIILPENGAVDPAKILTKSDTAKLLCSIEDYMIANNMKTIDTNSEND